MGHGPSDITSPPTVITVSITKDHNCINRKATALFVTCVHACIAGEATRQPYLPHLCTMGQPGPQPLWPARTCMDPLPLPPTPAPTLYANGIQFFSMTYGASAGYVWLGGSCRGSGSLPTRCQGSPGERLPSALYCECCEGWACMKGRMHEPQVVQHMRRHAGSGHYQLMIELSCTFLARSCLVLSHAQTLHFATHL